MAEGVQTSQLLQEGTRHAAEGGILRMIEEAALIILRDIANNKLPALFVPRYRVMHVDFIKNHVESGVYGTSSETWTSELGTRGNGTRLVAMVRILQLVQSLLQRRVHASKRDIYYTDVSLFKDQQTVDRGLVDICTYFNCPRSALNVVSASKGLVMGCLSYKENGHVVDCSLSRQTGLGIPSCTDNVCDISADADYILIVEKESAFMRLADDCFCQGNRAIVITGKGYPDVSTRLFLHKLASELSVPIFGLSDGDPYGIDIMSTYRFGSLQMAHDAQNMATPKLQWIGVFSSDQKAFAIPSRCRLSLSKRDYMKGRALLARPFLQSLAPDWCEQLKAMLDSGWKIEIEALAAISMTLLSQKYIPQKVALYKAED